MDGREIVKAKIKLNRQFALYFALFFLLSSFALLFGIFLRLEARLESELDDEIEKSRASIRLVFDSAIKTLDTKIDAVLAEPEFVRLLMAVRGGDRDFSAWSSLSGELAGLVNLEDVRILLDGVLISSVKRPELYGLPDTRFAASDENVIFDLQTGDGGVKLFLYRTGITEFFDGRKLKLIVSENMNEKLFPVVSILRNGNYYLKTGEKYYSVFSSMRAQDENKEVVFSPVARPESREKDERTIMSLGLTGGRKASLEIIVHRYQLAELKKDILAFSLLLIIAGLVVSALFGAIAAAPLKRRLEQLLKSMRLVSLGETKGVGMKLRSGDPLEALSGSFNSLIKEIEDQHNQILEAERIKAWRDIARKMAHEIKNPLSPIQISAETLVKAYEKRPNIFKEILTEKTEIIAEEVKRIKQTVDEFVEFARLPKPSIITSDIDALIPKVISLYDEYSNLSFKLDLTSGSPAQFDPNQVTRVLHNLIKNSIEAMGDGGGEIVIETRLMRLYNNDYVEVSVGDSGPGMTPQTLEKIFTPYFTTKPGGTGLGLLICYNIIYEHGGAMRIDSEEGKGTVVRFTLPAVMEKPDEENSA